MSADYDRLREWAETPAYPWPTDRWESIEVAMLALLERIDAAEQIAREWGCSCLLDNRLCFGCRLRTALRPTVIASEGSTP